MKAREVAYRILRDIFDKKQLLTDFYPYLFNKVEDERDRRLVVEIVYGVSRLKGRLEFALEKFAKKNKTNDKMWLFLLSCTYQILFLTRIPDYAVINESVNISKIVFNPKQSGFVNAVLKNIAKSKDSLVYPTPDEPDNFLQYSLSFPLWLGNKWIADYGLEETYEIIKFMNMKRPIVFRSFKGVDSFEGEYILHKTPYIENTYHGSVPINVLRAGCCYIMNESSQAVAELLRNFKGKYVLDATSSPGGKGFILASFENIENVIFNDISPDRTKLIEENNKDLLMNINFITCSDISKPSFRENFFDSVLLDAPCSGTGTISGHPELKWIRTPGEIKNRVKIQKMLIKEAFDLVKPGGVLVYSVCSMEREEGEDVVLDFVFNEENASFENPMKYTSESFKNRFKRFLINNNSYLRITPDKYLDGFFIALIKKNEQPE